MKLAYLGYDKTALKPLPVLEQHFSHIDFYLVNSDQVASDLDFLKLPIMAQNVCIPVDEALQTIKHKLVLHDIRNEYNALKQSLFSGFNLSADEFIGTKKSEKKQFELKDIVSIKFEKKINKHVIERQRHEPQEYNYLIIQGHQLVSDSVQSHRQNIIHRPQTQSFLILNLEFEMQYRLHKQYVHHDFIFIDNISLKTIFDNWYLCSFSQNKLSVGLYIPYAQHQSEEFLDYITGRVRALLSKSFEAFKIEELLSRKVSASDGFVVQALKLNYPKNSSVFPSFDYWPQNKINDYIKNVFVVKNKKNRNLFAEKEIS